MNKITARSLYVVFGLAGSAGMAQQALPDLHLKPIPRAEAETARVAAATALTQDFSRAEPSEIDQAGASTVPARTTADAFSQPSANISFERELDFQVGNDLFDQLWVPAPSEAIASDGLGPLYNALSCQRCHLKDGRGHPPEDADDDSVSMVMRVSIPATPVIDEIEAYLATLPDPVYGEQIQDFSIAGHAPEAQIKISYTEETIMLSGGETAALRMPTYALTELGYGPLDPTAMLSARVAPQMIGLGLLGAVPAQDILALADPQDTDGDGISGRAQIVMSHAHGVPMLGRFGLKAGTPSLLEQSASAFQGDTGISTTLLPAGYGDCTLAQSMCRAAPNGNSAEHNDAEISDLGMELITFYSRNLAVPARRDVDAPEVLRGKKVFYETGCTGCHNPKFVTHRLEGQPEQSYQLIWPYTDMLLHDMGPGLADNRPEARATGREWRTPPLWGIGLTENVSGHTYFLHDGRARSLLEAVLWHGGEAEAQKQRVIDMSPVDRTALIRFLESL